MTFLGNLQCTPRGSTVVQLCVFDPLTAALPRGRVRAIADLWPDLGATGETDAVNELLISFYVTVQPTQTAQTYLNQGTADWDVLGDGSLILTGVTDDTSTGNNNDPTVIVIGPPVEIPLLSPVA